MLVELTIEEGVRLKVIYGSNRGFHAIDLDTASVSDIYIPASGCHFRQCLCPKCDRIVNHFNICGQVFIKFSCLFQPQFAIISTYYYFYY